MWFMKRQEPEQEGLSIIALGGPSKAGKSVVRDYILMEKGQGWVIANTSDIICNLYAQRVGLSVDQVKSQKDKHREGIQLYGDFLERQEPALLMKMALLDAKAKTDNIRGIVVDSVRRRSELWYLEQSPNVKFVHVWAWPDILEKRGYCAGNHETEYPVVIHAARGYEPIHNNDCMASLRERTKELCLLL